MDLRILRTRKCIVDTFMELRKSKPLEKITVKEIADNAMINKATFYNHFDSVYDLSDKLENEAIEAVLKSINPDNWSTGEGTRLLVTAMIENHDCFNTLFSDSRRGVYAAKLEKLIKQTIYVSHPEYKESLEKDIVLTTMIYGCFYAMINYTGEDYEKTIDTIVNINEVLINKFCS